MSKGNFLLSDEWKTMFVSLPDAEAGQLIKAAFCYHSGDEVQIDDPVIAAIFQMIKEKIDENEKKYADTCQKRADAARARVSKSKQMHTSGSKSQQTAPDSEYDYENDIDTHLKVSNNPPLSPRRYFADERVDERYQEYLKSRKENKHPLKSETSIKANAKKLHNMATVNGRFDPDLALRILDQSIANGWQGLFEVKDDYRVQKQDDPYAAINAWYAEEVASESDQRGIFDTG